MASTRQKNMKENTPLTPFRLEDFYTIYEWIFARNVTDLHIMLDHRYTPSALVNCSIFGFAVKFPVSSFHAFSLSGLCHSFKGAHEAACFCAGWENGSQPSSYHNTEVNLHTSGLAEWAGSKGGSLVKFRLPPNVCCGDIFMGNIWGQFNLCAYKIYFSSALLNIFVCSMTHKFKAMYFGLEGRWRK